MYLVSHTEATQRLDTLFVDNFRPLSNQNIKVCIKMRSGDLSTRELTLKILLLSNQKSHTREIPRVKLCFGLMIYISNKHFKPHCSFVSSLTWTNPCQTKTCVATRGSAMLLLFWSATNAKIEPTGNLYFSI